MFKNFITLTVALLVVTVNSSSAQALTVDQGKAQLQSAWQKRIAEHRQANQELSRLEEQIMDAQLRGDAALTNKLMRSYMEAVAARHATAQALIRQTGVQFEQAEQVQRQMLNTIDQQQSDAGKVQLRQYLEFEKQRRSVLSQAH